MSDLISFTDTNFAYDPFRKFRGYKLSRSTHKAKSMWDSGVDVDDDEALFGQKLAKNCMKTGVVDKNLQKLVPDTNLKLVPTKKFIYPPLK